MATYRRDKEPVKYWLAVLTYVGLIATAVIGVLVLLFNKDVRCRNIRNGYEYARQGCPDVTGYDFAGNPIKK